MKKNIFTALLLLLSVSAMAQKEIDSSYRLYAQAHINGSWSASEELRYTKFKNALGWGADFELGYNFNDFWGAYVGVEWNKNKAATHNTIDYTLAGCKYSFTSIEPNLAVTYNLSNGILGYKPGRRNNFYVHVGPSIALRNSIEYGDRWFTENADDLNKKTLIGGKLGLNYVYHFNNWVALTADVTGTIYGDKFNGRHDDKVNVDGRINLGVGLRVYLTKSTKPAQEIVYRDEIIVKHDTLRTYEEKLIRDIDLYPVFFDTDKSAIEAVQAPVIKTVAEKLIANPTRIVYVIGYADKGTDAKKKVSAVAKERADAITNELINKYGIDPERIVEHDMGSAVTPYMSNAEKNRSTICIVTDLKHQ